MVLEFILTNCFYPRIKISVFMEISGYIREILAEILIKNVGETKINKNS